jgi:hypothetical protein
MTAVAVLLTAAGIAATVLIGGHAAQGATTPGHPVVLVVPLRQAVHLMGGGYWCTRLAGRSYQCTPAVP